MASPTVVEILPDEELPKSQPVSGRLLRTFRLPSFPRAPAMHVGDDCESPVTALHRPHPTGEALTS